MRHYPFPIWLTLYSALFCQIGLKFTVFFLTRIGGQRLFEIKQHKHHTKIKKFETIWHIFKYICFFFKFKKNIGILETNFAPESRCFTHNGQRGLSRIYKCAHLGIYMYWNMLQIFANNLGFNTRGNFSKYKNCINIIKEPRFDSVKLLIQNKLLKLVS